MLTLAQDMFKVIQDRFRTTMTVMADLAVEIHIQPGYELRQAAGMGNDRRLAAIIEFAYTVFFYRTPWLISSFIIT